MREKTPQKPQSNQEIVEQSAARRAAYTRRFMDANGINMQNFIERLSKAPFNIKNNESDKKDIDPNNDLILTRAIYQLQTSLQLPNEINRQGCDGMFGPYTFKRYAIAIESHQKRSALRSEIKPPVKPKTENQPPKISQPKEQLPDQPHLLVARNHLSKEYKSSEAFIAGDSLGVFASRHLARMQGKADRSFYTKHNFVKGARRLVYYPPEQYPKRKKWGSVEKEAMRALEQPECKLLYLTGGYNDLTSAIRWAGNRSPEGQRKALKRIVDSIVSSYKRVINKAHSMQPKKEVVLLTLNHQKAGKRRPKWMTPQLQKLVKEGTDMINHGIYSESGADMIVETNNLDPEYHKGGDGLHWSSRGAKEIIKATELA